MKDNIDFNEFSDRDLLKKLYTGIQSIKEDLHKIESSIQSIPEWISITDIANDRGMSKEAVRQRVLSGDYELEKDYKYDGKRLVVNKSVIHTIKRQRRPKGTK